MIDAELPPGPAEGLLARSFAACLASAVEVRADELPPPGTDLGRALGAWRTWLAEHGSGLVPVAEPDRFAWAGWWIAVVDDPAQAAEAGEVAVLAFGTPPGVVLSPAAPALTGRATADLRVTRAFVVASLDPVLHGGLAGAPSGRVLGTVEALAVAPAAEAPMQLLEVVRARAGHGFEGDRYAAGAGTFSPRADRRPGYDLTLIAAEALEEVSAAGTALGFAGSRRNVLTRGVDVNALVGRRFRLGDVLCEGRRLCEPCAHLERLSGPGVLRPLIHRGGLRVDVLSDGEVRRGAPVLPA